LQGPRVGEANWTAGEPRLSMAWGAAITMAPPTRVSKNSCFSYSFILFICKRGRAAALLNAPWWASVLATDRLVFEAKYQVGFRGVRTAIIVQTIARNFRHETKPLGKLGSVWGKDLLWTGYSVSPG